MALTLRHDRVDNFWFTLLHDLAHATLHLGANTSIILDDLDVNSSVGAEAYLDPVRHVWRKVRVSGISQSTKPLARQGCVAVR